MATSYGALCTDFYVNQKLALKMDLPSERETVLHLCDRIQKSIPSMNRFHRYDGELSLESKREVEYRWLAIRRTSIRTGHVNPESMEEAYGLHRLVLEVAPYHLTISPLDVDYLELLYGFDLECDSNHDEVVYDALFADTPLSKLMNVPGSRVLELQPNFGLKLSETGDLQAHFEVRTRTKSRRGSSRRYRDEPLSLFLIMRKYGPVTSPEQLQEVFTMLAEHADRLASERLVPELLTPISRQITSSNA